MIRSDGVIRVKCFFRSNNLFDNFTYGKNMKSIFISAAVMTFVLGACSKESTPPAQPAAQPQTQAAPATAPAGEPSKEDKQKAMEAAKAAAKSAGKGE